MRGRASNTLQEVVHPVFPWPCKVDILIPSFPNEAAEVQRYLAMVTWLENVAVKLGNFTNLERKAFEAAMCFTGLCRITDL